MPLESTTCAIAHAAAKSACADAWFTDDFAAGTDGTQLSAQVGDEDTATKRAYSLWCADTTCNAALSQVITACSESSAALKEDWSWDESVCSPWDTEFTSYYSEAEARLAWCSTPCLIALNQRETVCPGDCDKCACDTTGNAACESCPINECRVWLGDVELQCNAAMIDQYEQGREQYSQSQIYRDLATNLGATYLSESYAQPKLLSCPVFDFASAEEAFTFSQQLRSNWINLLQRATTSDSYDSYPLSTADWEAAIDWETAVLCKARPAWYNGVEYPSVDACEEACESAWSMASSTGNWSLRDPNHWGQDCDDFCEEQDGAECDYDTTGQYECSTCGEWQESNNGCYNPLDDKEDCGHRVTCSIDENGDLISQITSWEEECTYNACLPGDYTRSPARGVAFNPTLELIHTADSAALPYGWEAEALMSGPLDVDYDDDDGDACSSYLDCDTGRLGQILLSRALVRARNEGHLTVKDTVRETVIYNPTNLGSLTMPGHELLNALLIDVDNQASANSSLTFGGGNVAIIGGSNTGAGPINVSTTGKALLADMTNTGIVSVVGTALAWVLNAQNLAGGVMTMSDMNANVYQCANAGSMTFTDGTVNLEATTNLAGGVLSVSGTTATLSSSTNEGTLTIADSVVEMRGTFHNAGTMTATGGTYTAYAGGRRRMEDAAVRATNAGTITIDGGATADFTLARNEGHLTLGAGTYTITVENNSGGTITVADTSATGTILVAGGGVVDLGDNTNMAVEEYIPGSSPPPAPPDMPSPTPDIVIVLVLVFVFALLIVLSGLVFYLKKKKQGVGGGRAEKSAAASSHKVKVAPAPPSRTFSGQGVLMVSSDV